MPFGLCNAPATFEQLMERVLLGIPWSRCVVYLNDRFSPYRYLALPVVSEGSDSSTLRVDQCDSPPSASPVILCGLRPVHQQRQPGHLIDFVLGDGVAEDNWPLRYGLCSDR